MDPIIHLFETEPLPSPPGPSAHRKVLFQDGTPIPGSSMPVMGGRPKIAVAIICLPIGWGGTLGIGNDTNGKGATSIAPHRALNGLRT